MWIVLCPVFFACHKIQKFTIGKNISLKEHSKCKHDFLDNSSFQPLSWDRKYVSYERHVKLLRISLKFGQFYVKEGWKSLSCSCYIFFFWSETWRIKWGNFLKSRFLGKDLDFQKNEFTHFNHFVPHALHKFTSWHYLN